MDTGDFKKKREKTKISVYIIFSLTRYPAPERKSIKIKIAVRYARPETITMGNNASIRIRMRKPNRPMTTSRSRASITGIYAIKEYMYIRTFFVMQKRTPLI
jgi:hypothetical protein